MPQYFAVAIILGYCALPVSLAEAKQFYLCHEEDNGTKLSLILYF
jgi:hypothetical protein